MTEIIIAEDRLQRLETYANEEENGEMIEVITAYRTLINTIESQKEEIEKLKSRLEAKYTFISNGMEEDQYVLQESVIAKDAEIESLKAVTELAVKGLKEITKGAYHKTYLINVAEDTLDEIEKLQK